MSTQDSYIETACQQIWHSRAPCGIVLKDIPRKTCLAKSTKGHQFLQTGVIGDKLQVHCSHNVHM